MHRSVEAVAGALLLGVGVLTQHPLSWLAMVGTGLVFLAWATAGRGPKPRFPIPIEVGLLLAAVALVAAAAGIVAYLIPGG